MKKIIFKSLVVAIVASVILLGCSNYNSTSNNTKMKMKMSFGTQSDVEYAKYLWQKLEKSTLNSTPATLYVGGPPHGKVREVLEGTIDGKKVIVKRNYGGKGVSIQNVKNDREKYLKAITVMIKKDGYDPKNKDWFWAKYKMNGSLHMDPSKTHYIAGKVGSCISCHASASGNDYVFTHNKAANANITIVN